MIEIFKKTMRPLILEKKFLTKNLLGEMVAEHVEKQKFLGAIFSASARERQLFGDIALTEYPSVLYSDQKFSAGDVVADGAKKFRVVASIENRDMNGKIDYYKTLLLAYE